MCLRSGTADYVFHTMSTPTVAPSLRHDALPAVTPTGRLALLHALLVILC